MKVQSSLCTKPILQVTSVFNSHFIIETKAFMSCPSDISLQFNRISNRNAASWDDTINALSQCPTLDIRSLNHFREYFPCVRINEFDAFRWIAGDRGRPRRRLKAPFAAGEDDVYALPAGELREDPSCVEGRRVRDEEGSNNYSCGRCNRRSNHGETPVQLLDLWHPEESFIPISSFSLSHFLQGIIVVISFLSHVRELLESTWQEWRDGNVKKCRQKSPCWSLTICIDLVSSRRRVLLSLIRQIYVILESKYR